MEDLPDRSNLHGTLHTALEREAIVAAFVASGWSMRRCGAAEYDLRTSFAELVLESEHPFLIHGSVADIVANAQRIADVLRAAAIAFVLECYAEGGALIMQLDA